MFKPSLNTEIDRAFCILFLAKGGIVADAMAMKGNPAAILGMRSGLAVNRLSHLRQVIKRHNPDIIFCHVRNFLANAVITRNAAPVKLYYEHGADLVSTSPLKESLFYRLFSHRYHAILTNSNYTKTHVLGLCTKATRVLTHPMGVDTLLFNPLITKDAARGLIGLPHSQYVVGTVCRLVPQKGVDDFLAAAVAINALHPGGIFVVAGAGPLRQELETSARKTGLDIRFLGERSDIPSVLRSFDIFLMTSKWEPYGIAVIEALAAGVPVLGFAVGGVPEILEGGGGILNRDRSIDELSALVVQVLKDRVKWENLSEQAVENARRNYDIRTSMVRLESEFSRMLGYS
jgi:glycosyltransferase involved in cell wall biosynthesis